MNCQQHLETLPHDILVREVLNCYETVDFLTSKVNRQGRFISYIADELLKNGDSTNHFENFIYNKFLDHMNQEVEILRQRMREIEAKI